MTDKEWKEVIKNVMNIQIELLENLKLDILKSVNKYEIIEKIDKSIGNKEDA